MTEKLILVTGASGYIAGRLIPRLLERGYRVRAMARRPSQLAARPWRKRVELISGDTTVPASLTAALDGVHTAYYLIHNMQVGRGYTQVELEGAHSFASAAEGAGVNQIVYLGGLADPNDPHLASHLRSRMETGEMLRRGSVPVTEFRAGVIAGAGSISFEMIRFMTEALPLMIGPTWLKNKAQPIATENVIDYLVEMLENPYHQNRILEVGSDEVTTYRDLMLRYARIRGLKRRLILLPGVPRWFMAMGVTMLAPVPYRIAYALIGGLASSSVVQHDEARRIFPDVKLIDFEEATANTLGCLSPASMDRVWEGSARDVMQLKHEGFFVDYRRVQINASPESIYQILTSLGGKNGWLYANWLWKLRGWLDQLLGGPGLRGRSDSLTENSILDYFRVEAMEPNHLLRLHSESRAPGEGWLEWQAGFEDRPSTGSGRCVLAQTAFFAPHGFPGFLCWYLFSPLHRLVFRGLLQAIKRRSEKL